jgi:hypothetical protein
MTDIDSAIEGLNDQFEDARRMAFRLIGMLQTERDTLVKANERLRLHVGVFEAEARQLRAAHEIECSTATAALRSLDSARDDSARLDWLCRNLRGDDLRRIVGELNYTGDGSEFRRAIDAAMGKRHD